MSSLGIRSFRTQVTKSPVSRPTVQKAQGILRQIGAAGHNTNTHPSGAAAREIIAKANGK